MSDNCSNPNDSPIIKLFLFNDKYYCYDAYSNSLLEISKDIFVELNRLIKLGISSCLNSGKNSIQFASVCSLMKKGLINKPFINTIKHPETDYVDSLINRHINDLTLQVTRECNFNCRYCLFANDNNIGRAHERVNMPLSIAKKSIDFLRNHSLDSTSITIGFYGGEPMLNFNLIKAAVEYAETVFYSKKLIFRMTINGSILSDSMLDFIVEHDFIIVISLDGSELLQNKHRKFRDSGTGTFTKVMQNIERIRTKYKTYFQNNVSFMSVVFDDEDSNRVIEFYNSVGIPDYAVKLMSADLSGVDYYIDYLDLIDNDNPLDRSFYDRMIKIMNKKNTLPQKWHPPGQCIPAIKSLFVNVYGEFYPCEKLIEQKYLSIGNLERGLDAAKIGEIMNIGKLSENECKNCWAIRFCELCVAQCFDIESGIITKETMLNSCKKQRLKALYFLKKFLKYNNANNG